MKVIFHREQCCLKCIQQIWEIYIPGWSQIQIQIQIFFSQKKTNKNKNMYVIFYSNHKNIYFTPSWYMLYT